MRDRWQRFRGRFAPPGGSLASTGTAPETEDDTQAARAILALAIERYQYEHGRTKDIEAKASPTLGLTGAILVLAAGTLTDGAPCLRGGEHAVYDASAFGGILFLVGAGALLLRTRCPAEFTCFALADWVTNEETRRAPSEGGRCWRSWPVRIAATPRRIAASTGGRRGPTPWPTSPSRSVLHLSCWA